MVEKFLSAAIAFFLLAIGSAASSEAQTPISLPAILPLSGPGAFLGKEEQEAMQIGRAHV